MVGSNVAVGRTVAGGAGSRVDVPDESVGRSKAVGATVGMASFLAEPEQANRPVAARVANAIKAMI